MATMKAGESSDRFIGERLRGVSLHLLGNHKEARICIERMLDHYVPPADRAHTVRFHFDQQAMARNTLARIFWAEGHPGEALHKVRENIRHTNDIGHQLSLTNVLAEAACPIAFLIGDLDLCEQYTAQLRDETRAKALDIWSAFAECFTGDLLIRRGQVAEGVALLRPNIEKLSRVNFLFHHTAFLSALASGLAKAGERQGGQAVIDMALSHCGKTGEGWFLPELYRVKGEIALLATPNPNQEAEASFERAVHLARRQGASSWELRAGTSLSKLWLAQRKVDQAHQLLAPIYETFSKDIDTRDLADAAVVLEACRRA
jgi:predicted ATPase